MYGYRGYGCHELTFVILQRFHNRLALATNKQKQLLQKGVPGMILQVVAASKGMQEGKGESH